MTRRTLHVVSTRAWVAREFADAAPPSVAVTGSLGLDVPRGLLNGDALWSPMEWAARAVVAGADLRLLDPGATWLPQVSEPLRRRRIEVMPLSEARARGAGAAEMFVKPANMKVEALPAGWQRLAAFASAADDTGLPDDAEIMLCDRRLTFVEEHRVFVRGGRPVASSPYLIDAHTWFPGMSSPRTGAAVEFAAQVCLEMSDAMPDAFVLDVGLTAATASSPARWTVIEANPAWASNPYGCDMSEVLSTVLAANATSTAWQWRPDPYLLARAHRQRRLRIG